MYRNWSGEGLMRKHWNWLNLLAVLGGLLLAACGSNKQEVSDLVSLDPDKPTFVAFYTDN